jgi:hypothetical protein
MSRRPGLSYKPPEIEISNAAKAYEINLCIDGRASGTAMSKKIANTLHIKVLMQQSGCTCVPKRVRPVMCQFWCDQLEALAHNLPKSAVAEGLVRHVELKKNLTSF